MPTTITLKVRNLSFTSSYTSTRLNKEVNSANLSLIYKRFVSFSTISDMVEAAKYEVLLFMDQGTKQWLEKIWSYQIIIHQIRVIKKHTTIRQNEFPWKSIGLTTKL